MEREFLHQDYWDQFTPAEAEVIARTLARLLPAPWQFEAVEAHACGDQRRAVAFFRREGSRFALVPGGAVAVGYDHGRPLGPDLQRHRDWIAEYEPPEEPDEFGSDEDEDAFYADEQRQTYFVWSEFFRWLADLPPRRDVSLAPYLIEAEPQTCEGLAAGATFAELTAAVAVGGLRLPTSDEWEFACAAGSRTVWRWGDVCPDHCHEDCGDDLIHFQSNAFGLRYHGAAAELVAEPGLRRNTDGGVALCGGHGFPCGWLSLASAQVLDYHARRWRRPNVPLEPWLRVRRAFTVPEAALD